MKVTDFKCRMHRRNFLRTGAGAAGTIALNAFPHHLFAAETKKYATDRVKLGPRGVEVSRLAMGTGTNGVGGSSNQTRKLGVQGLAELFRASYGQGVTFWDSADQYGTHPHVREALKTVPRDKVAILTKTHAHTYKEMKADIDRFRRELGTDYIDIVLLHAMMDGDWNVRNRGAMDAQLKGTIRTKGTSCHTLEALKTAAGESWVEVDLCRINPAQIAMDADPKTVIAVQKQMKAAGKGVIGMKILGAGRLRSKPDEALQFALSLDTVDCFTIGSESRAEMEDLLRKIPAASTRG
jgi:aryl-alcohol dehydrogenase-like predicted oxidoreductase